LSNRCNATCDPAGNYRGAASGDWKDELPLRTNQETRESARLFRECTSQGDRDAKSKETGVFSSVLLDLEYFDASRMAVFDATHWLFRGKPFAFQQRCAS